MAALTFCFDTLRTGGHFVCKYYQGNEEKDLELRLKKLFEKVHREKPESSRNVRAFPCLQPNSAVGGYKHSTRRGRLNIKNRRNGRSMSASRFRRAFRHRAKMATYTSRALESYEFVIAKLSENVKTLDLSSVWSCTCLRTSLQLQLV